MSSPAKPASAGAGSRFSASPRLGSSTRLTRRASALSAASVEEGFDLRHTSDAAHAAEQEEEEEEADHDHAPRYTLRKPWLTTIALLSLACIGAVFQYSYSPLLHSNTILLRHTMQCEKDGKMCRVHFSDPSNDLDYKIQLFPQQRSLFADNLVVVDEQGEERMATSEERNAHQLFETRVNGQQYVGAGLVNLETNTLVSGIFITPGGEHVIEHNVRANRHHGARKLGTEEGEDDHVILEMPGVGQPWLEKPRGGGGGAPQTLLVQNRAQIESGIIRFFPGCYANDEVTHVFKMNVVYDYGLASGFSTVAEALADLDLLFSVGKLVFLSQLNIRLEVNKFILGRSTDAVPLRRGGASCIAAVGALPEAITWSNAQRDKTGFNLVLSNCFSGITGTSYIGSACSANMNANVAAHSWLVAFHELGHAFGMAHSFEDGVGQTGGIMDYGDGLYKGVTQFHPYTRERVCPFLDNMVANCPFLLPAAVDSACGDGILTKTEACECLVPGVTKCGKCEQCQIRSTAGIVECSAEEFLLRTEDTPEIAVVSDEALRARAQCCTKEKRFAPAKTLCSSDGGPLLDVCSRGQCVRKCTKYLDWNNANCGFDATGCNIGCVFNQASCRFDLSYTDPNSGQYVSVNALPDGTKCLLEQGSGEGVCKDAQCVKDAGQAKTPAAITMAPSTATTAAPEDAVLEDTVNKSVCAALKRAKCRKAKTCKWAQKQCLDKTKNLAMAAVQRRVVVTPEEGGEEYYADEEDYEEEV